MTTDPLIIKDWETGIADSPHLGFGLFRNVEIGTYPGSVLTGKKPETLFHTAYTSTFTAVAATDICTATVAAVSQTGTAITLTTTGTLPAGLSISTNYFVIRLSTSTFKLATTIALAEAGTGIDITSTGTGTHTITTVTPGTIMQYTVDPRVGDIYVQDSNGLVWFPSAGNGSTYLLLNGNTLTGAVGNGLVAFGVTDNTATYLFAFRNASIDVINVYGSSNRKTPVWSNSWKALNSSAGSGNSHYAIVAQDNIIYFCDDKYVGSIKENTGFVFDPATAGTYTFNNQALDLPNYAATYWLEELGTNLLITASNQNKVYPWDRISDSFSLPLMMPEHGNKMKNIGNIVYILAGTTGNIYKTQGSYVQLFKSIPTQLSNNGNSLQSNTVTWGGITALNGSLLVGVGTVTSGNSGVYLIKPDGTMTIDNVPSTGSSRATMLYAENEFYYIGFSGGVDRVGLSSRYTSYEGVIHSPLYRVSSKTEKGQYSTIELQIAKPITGAVRIKYRNDIVSSFADFPSGAVVFSTTTSDTSYKQDIGLTDIENLQIQIEMNGTIEIMQVSLIP